MGPGECILRPGWVLGWQEAHKFLDARKIKGRRFKHLTGQDLGRVINARQMQANLFAQLLEESGIKLCRVTLMKIFNIAGRRGRGPNLSGCLSLRVI